MSIPINGLNGTAIVPSQVSLGSQQAPEVSGFENLLNSMLVPDDKGQVNEEQLFSALINERLTDMKGSNVALEYQNRFAENQKQLQFPNGYIPLETSARNALESLADDGFLSREEAENIHSQAFKAAQIDDNKNALYDSFGSRFDDTIAVTMVKMAIEAAESEISKFDKGAADAGRLAFDIAGDTLPDEIVQPGTEHYADGLIWKPASDSNGDAAIILQSSLRGNIDSVTLHDNKGNTMEEKQVVMVDEKGRSILFFDRPGSGYHENLTVQVAMKNGEIIKYKVTDPSHRLGY